MAASGSRFATGGAAVGVLQAASKERQLRSGLENKSGVRVAGHTLSSWNCAGLTSCSPSAAILRCMQLHWPPKNCSLLLAPCGSASPWRGFGRRCSLCLKLKPSGAAASSDMWRASSADAPLVEEATKSQETEYVVVRIETSRFAGSSLSRPEDGAMVALLGPAGKFVLRKLGTQGDEENEGSRVCGTRGSFDIGATAEAHFRGPLLDRIDGIWLSPVSGTWRPAAASVLVKQASTEAGTIALDVLKKEAENEINPSGLSEPYKRSQSSETSVGGGGNKLLESDSIPSVLYLFKWNEGLIGEGCKESAAQLIPAGVHTEDAMSQLASTSSDAVEELVAVRAAGLAEYQELKMFLLGTTAALVGVGTLGSKLAFGDEVGIGFAAGGLGGLLYLLLLERTVDQLGNGEGAQATGTVHSSGTLSQTIEASGHIEGPLDRILNRVALLAKGPASRLILVALLGLVAVKYVGGSDTRNLEPRQILGGLAGFLVYKLAVLSAAFRPTDQVSKS